MKGRAKLLDSGFREFIEYLQKMGELHNILRMIDSFYSMNGMDCSELDTGHYNVEKGGFDMVHGKRVNRSSRYRLSEEKLSQEYSLTIVEKINGKYEREKEGKGNSENI